MRRMGEKDSTRKYFVERNTPFSFGSSAFGFWCASALSRYLCIFCLKIFEFGRSDESEKKTKCIKISCIIGLRLQSNKSITPGHIFQHTNKLINTHNIGWLHLVFFFCFAYFPCAFCLCPNCDFVIFTFLKLPERN